MRNKLIELNLPDFAFLDGISHEGDTLEGRDVVLHIRSASVLEFIPVKYYIPKNDVQFIKFEYHYEFGATEEYYCLLHYSAIVDDVDEIFEKIMKPAVKWYINYCKWEDKNILN